MRTLTNLDVFSLIENKLHSKIDISNLLMKTNLIFVNFEIFCEVFIFSGFVNLRLEFIVRRLG